MSAVAALTVSAQVKAPDFAYPKTVKADAEKGLKNAGDDGVAQLDCLMQLTVADNLIDKAGTQKSLERVLEYGHRQKNPQVAALFNLYAATVANNIYQSNQWKYDRRRLPLTPRPKDMTEWSGEMFRVYVDSLCGEGLAAAGNMPVAEFLRVVNADETQQLYFPTLHDFATGVALNLGLNSNPVQAERIYKPDPDYLYSQALDFHRADTAPWYAWTALYPKKHDATRFMLDLFRRAKNRRDALVLWQSIMDNIQPGDSILTNPGFREQLKTATEIAQTTVFANMFTNFNNTVYAASARASAPAVAPENKPFEVSITNVRNAGMVTVSFMRFATEKARDNYLRRKTGKAVETKDFKVEFTPSPVSQKRTVKAILPAGFYALNVTADGKSNRNNSVGSVDVLPFMAVLFNSPQTAVAMVYSSDGGKPLAGAKVSLVNNKNVVVSTATTDKNGRASFPVKVGSYFLRVSAAGIVKDFNDERVYKDERTRRHDNRGRVSIATQRGLYHPGDSVAFVAVAMNDSLVIADKKLTVTLLDVEGKEADRAEGVTDAFGRFAAVLAIPDVVERTGNFRLRTDGENIYGSTPVTVSDYKLQGIEMADFKAVANARADSSATVTGLVRTFSGQPLSNATVTVRLSVNDSVKAVETLTDAEGKFRVVAKYPAPVSRINRYIGMTAMVTGPDGNTVSRNTSLDAIFPYDLSVRLPERDCSVLKPVKISYKLYNQATDSLSAPVNWQLLKDKKTVAEGSLAASPAELNLRDVKTGVYSLRFATADTLMAERYATEIALYNPETTVIPDSARIFYLPVRTVNVKNGKASLRVGVNRNVWLTAATAEDGKAPMLQNFRLTPGYHTLDINVGDSERIELLGVNDLETQSYVISITREEKPLLNVTLESFRDKVVSGSEERWSLKVTDRDGHDVDAAMVANVHDYRLDLLRSPATLWLSRIFDRPVPLSLSQQYFWTSSASFLASYKDLETYWLTIPEWKYTLSEYRRGRYRRSALMLTGSVKATKEADVLYSKADYSAPAAAPVVNAMGAELKESAMEDGAAPDAPDAGAPGVAQPEIRTGELVNALWAPMLTARNGLADICFKVPNANSTWAADVTVFTRDLASANVSKRFVSQKPVMVSINAPRFLRVGDNASVIASYMNTTDKSLTVNAVLVGSDSLSRSLTLQPGETQTMTVPIKVNAVTDSIFVTATAATDMYADGERHVIPVFSSQALVTDARNFYINSGDTVFTMELPRPKGENFSMNLTYTENPMWTVVEALPTLLGKEIAPTANAQAAAYFSSALALGLMTDHPELEYKFSRKDLQRTMSSALKNLQKLQTADGSFQWGPWSSGGNLWTTASVLDFMSTLKRCGYLPDKADINRLLTAAVKYYDKEVRDVDMTYAIIRPAFKEVPQSLNGQSVTQKTLQYINRNWKRMDIGTKAQAATTLHFNGADHMARTVMESVDQFGTQTPSKGYEFKNVTSLQTYAWLLEAYAGIDPKSEHVDGIRQYLIVRRQATDWGNSAITSWIVNAMVTSGTPWATPAQGTVVRLQDGVMQFTPAERMGTLTTEVSGPSMTLEMSGKTPSYGAVTATYVQPMADVKAFSDGKIYVEKELLVQDRATSKYKHVDRNTALKIGDRVKVVITVKSDRPMSHVTVTDDRAAALEPVDQLPGYVYADGVCAYRENRDSATNLYLDYLPKGTYLFKYELTVNNAGVFSTGLATVTCTQAPTLTAHSSGSVLCIP